jgi:hypothetical protein
LRTGVTNQCAQCREICVNGFKTTRDLSRHPDCEVFKILGRLRFCAEGCGYPLAIEAIFYP